MAKTKAPLTPEQAEVKAMKKENKFKSIYNYSLIQGRNVYEIYYRKR